MLAFVQPAQASVESVMVGNGPSCIYASSSSDDVTNVPGVSFDASTSTLTLDNANIIANDVNGRNGIDIDGGDIDVTVVVNGDNTIVGSGNGISTNGTLRFVGSGTLTVVGSEYGIYSRNYNLVFAGPTVTARGQNAGIFGFLGVKVTDGKISAEGKTNSIGTGGGGAISNKPANLGAIKGELGYGARFKKGSVTYQKLESHDLKLVKWGNGKTLNTKKAVSFGGYSKYWIAEIGTKACKGCRKLKKAVIHWRTYRIGKQAFANCKNLKLLDVSVVGTQVIDSATGKAGGIGKKAFAGAGAKNGKGLKVKCGWGKGFPDFRKGARKALISKGLSKKANVVK